MRKYIFLLLFIVMVSGLSAQSHLWIRSDNISVAGAVTAELIKEINAQLGIEFHNYHVRFETSEDWDGWLKGVWVSLNRREHYPSQFLNTIIFSPSEWSIDYERSNNALYNLLKPIPYWTGNLQMINTGGGIQIKYPFNGNIYTVNISITPVG